MRGIKPTSLYFELQIKFLHLPGDEKEGVMEPDV